MPIQPRRICTTMALVATLAAAGAAQAATALTIGFTPVTGNLAAYVATDEGFFAKQGVDAKMIEIPIGTDIPAALVSDSIQIGAPTPTVVLQANDAGLDLVMLTATSVFPNPDPGGLVARFGSDIKTPKDVVGKRVGVPGLNGFLHVMFRRYLKLQGVDDSGVKYVEVPFPRFPDALKSGNIDAYPAVDPFFSRAIATKAGYLVADWSQGIPDGTLTVVLVATRKWSTDHPDAVMGFRAAMREATEFINVPANEPAWRKSLAKHTGLPPPVVANIAKPNLGVDITPEQVKFWIDICHEQNMIKGNPDPASVIFK